MVNKGNRSKTAEETCMSRSTLRRKMAMYWL
ncbi:MAG: hypothetical protein GY866_39565 [Proteobacteria bacterium]|nr:hypothetical protein [Pseudomonadota bacterium]